MTSGRDVDCSESKQASETGEDWGYVVCTVDINGKWMQMKKWFCNLEDAKVAAGKISEAKRIVKRAEVWEAFKEPKHHHERNKPLMKVYEVGS